VFEPTARNDKRYPMHQSDMMPHFRKLWEDLPDICEKVDLLESPNLEDDRMVKFAIVGYSYHQPVDSWGRDEFEFVAHRRREVAEYDPRWIEFVCLASGYLLGLANSESINDTEFAIFEAQLPGFMWLHSERFQG
jgi:hypothetical protein